MFHLNLFILRANSLQSSVWNYNDLTRWQISAATLTPSVRPRKKPVHRATSRYQFEKFVVLIFSFLVFLVPRSPYFLLCASYSRYFSLFFLKQKKCVPRVTYMLEKLCVCLSAFCVGSEGEIEVGTELHEKELLPVYRSLPVASGYMAGIWN